MDGQKRCDGHVLGTQVGDQIPEAIDVDDLTRPALRFQAWLGANQAMRLFAGRLLSESRKPTPIRQACRRGGEQIAAVKGGGGIGRNGQGRDASSWIAEEESENSIVGSH